MQKKSKKYRFSASTKNRRKARQGFAFNLYCNYGKGNKKRKQKYRINELQRNSKFSKSRVCNNL